MTVMMHVTIDSLTVEGYLIILGFRMPYTEEFH